jgi:hypothetical protein
MDELVWLLVNEANNAVALWILDDFPLALIKPKWSVKRVPYKEALYRLELLGYRDIKDRRECPPKSTEDSPPRWFEFGSCHECDMTFGHLRNCSKYIDRSDLDQ